MAIHTGMVIRIGKMRSVATYLILLFVIPVYCQNGDAGVQVRYIANEGVIISGGDKSVMIDAVHRYYGDDYLYPSDDELEAMIKGTDPFSSVDLLLVSHVHGDHFDAASVSRFLEEHPETLLISSAQTIDSLNLYAVANVRSRLSIADHRQDRRTEYNDSGVALTVLGIKHGSKRFNWVQNLGHIVTVNGVKLLHVGDASLDLRRFEGLNLVEENIDIAIIPYWYIYDRDKMDSLIGAESYILTHISPKEDHSMRTWETEYPDVRMFIEAGEIYTY